MAPQTLTAGTGIGVDPTTGIGTTSTEIKTNVTTLNATTTTGDIFIVQPANPLTVSATSLGFTDPSTKTGSDINVTATTGDMTAGAVSARMKNGNAQPREAAIICRQPGSGRASASNVSADTLGLTAANGISASGSVRRLVPPSTPDRHRRPRGRFLPV